MLCDSHWKQHQQQRIRNCTPAWKPLQRSFFPEVNQNKACFIGFLSTASVAILLVVHFSVGIDHLLNKPNSLPSVTAERLWMQASVKLLLLLHVHLLREERTGDGVWPHTSRQHWPWQKKDRCPQSSVWSRGKIKERFWILLCFQAMKRCLSCSKQVIMSQFILQGGETGCSLTIVHETRIVEYCMGLPGLMIPVAFQWSLSYQLWVSFSCQHVHWKEDLPLCSHMWP